MRLKAIFLFTSLTIIFLITSCNQVAKDKIPFFDWIPQNSTLVFQINDKNKLESELKNNKILTFIKNSNPEISNSILNILPVKKSEKYLICLSNIGKDKIGFTYVGKSNIIDHDSLSKKINYGGFKINIIENPKGNYFSATIKNKYITSNSKLIIENYIRNHENNISRNISPLLNELKKSLDSKADINLLININKAKYLSIYKELMVFFPKINFSWNAFDLIFDNSNIELNGFMKIKDSLGDPLSLMKNKKFSETKLHRIVPNSFTSFFSIPFNNYESLEEKYKKYIINNNLSLKKNNLKTLNSFNEIGWLKTKEKKFLILRSKNINATKNLLSLEGKNQKKYRTVEYYPSEISSQLNTLSKIIANQVNAKWLAVLDDFFIYSETEKGLKDLINSISDKNVLSSSEKFLNFKNKLANENSFLWIGNPENIFYNWEKKLSKNNALKLDDFEKLNQVAFQGIYDQGYIHLYLRINQNGKEISKNKILNQYSFNLYSPALSSPVWIKNHLTKGMDIAVQDVNNVLYLFSNKGVLLWTKKLDSNIIGEIKQVDLYKNKKVQMAFRTEKKFIILDRNGDIVKPFSINLQNSEKAQPISVFDYEKNNNYRFVLSQDKSIKMYNSNGKIVKGFNFIKADSNIINPPVHIRIENKDYIIIQESSGKLNILDRRGNSRINYKEKIDFSKNKIYRYLNTFTTTNNQGELIQIDEKGNLILSNLNLEKSHQIVSDYNSLITFSKNILTIKGIPITLPYGNYTKPKLFYLNKSLYVSITEKDENKVYLFNDNGLIIDGFPIYGNSTIDMTNSDNDKALEIIVQSDEDEFIIYEMK